jgi:DNA-binding GntR family transcriptional regulator
MRPSHPGPDPYTNDRRVPRIVLSERVRELIVEEVLHGELEPGERIVESALARRLGVSQAPVREAIRELVLLGFLNTEPHRGTSVRTFTPAQLCETYTVRAALESLGARLAAERLTEGDAQALEAILDDMLEAGRQGDGDRLVQLENCYHETMLKVSRNKTLYQLWKTLQFGYWTMVTHRKSGDDPQFLAARHKELLEAIKSRDPKRAMYTMQHHMEELGLPPDEAGLSAAA